MRSWAVMAWSNSTWYYVSLAWCGTAVAPLITHWSCCSLAVGHQYNTVATGLGRKQSSNKKRHPTSRPHKWASGCLFFFFFFFLRIYEIYRAMTAPQPHWNLVCLFFPQRCTCCTPRTYNFVFSNVPFALIDALLSGSRKCKWEQIVLWFFIIIIFILFFFPFLLAPLDICFV